jgi:hypothetical protein
VAEKPIFVILEKQTFFSAVLTIRFQPEELHALAKLREFTNSSLYKEYEVL